MYFINPIIPVTRPGYEMGNETHMRFSETDVRLSKQLNRIYHRVSPPSRAFGRTMTRVSKVQSVLCAQAEVPPHLWGWLAVFSTACPPVRVWLIAAFKTMEPCEPEAGRRRQPNLGPRASMTPRVSIRRWCNEREEKTDHLSHLVQIMRRWDAETSTSAPYFFMDSPLKSDRYIKSKLQYKWHHVSQFRLHLCMKTSERSHVGLFRASLPIYCLTLFLKMCPVTKAFAL